MDPHTFNHYNRVARSMQNYVAVSTHRYYRRYDRIPGEAYHAGFHQNINHGTPYGDGFYSIGLPNFVYRIGQWIDYNL